MYPFNQKENYFIFIEKKNCTKLVGSSVTGTRFELVL